jgi:hypothetical protein
MGGGEAHQPLPQVVQPPQGVDDGAIGPFPLLKGQGHGVDGVVTGGEVLFDGALEGVEVYLQSFPLEGQEDTAHSLVA